jgi:16S rRNA G966 N2-methylase RsmD
MKEHNNMNQYVQHPFGSILPKMDNDEFAALCESIRSVGLKYPIVKYGGMILDGWHRLQACYKINVEPVFTQFVGNDVSALELVESSVTHRHLDKSQLGIVAAQFKKKMQELIFQAKITLKDDTNEESQKILTLVSTYESTYCKDLAPSLVKMASSGSADKSTVIASKKFGVNTDYIQYGEKLINERPELAKKVLNKELTFQDIKKQDKAAKNEQYRRRESQLKSTNRIERNKDDIDLFNCDILSADIADNSLDVIITDPPYPKEYLDCWKKLAQFAAKKLKDGGILIAASGQSYLPTVYKNMEVVGLNYYWTNCIYTPGVSAELQMKRLRTNWKPLLFYVKGEYKRTFQKTDVYVSEYEDTANGQKYHKWGQSYPVFEQIVLDYTYVNDVVCDPFLGGGTTGLACIENKRKFVGIELNTDTFNTAKERLSYGN